jgi:hypothetical protein
MACQQSDDSDDHDEKDYFEMSSLITRCSLEQLEKRPRKDDLALVYSKLATQTKSFKLFFNEDKAASNVNNKFKDDYNYILREILTTEETFLQIMKILVEDFLKPLTNVMTQEERRNTAINIGIFYFKHYSR